jgi:hypothetical protein
MHCTGIELKEDKVVNQAIDPKAKKTLPMEKKGAVKPCTSFNTLVVSH